MHSNKPRALRRGTRSFMITDDMVSLRFIDRPALRRWRRPRSDWEWLKGKTPCDMIGAHLRGKPIVLHFQTYHKSLEFGTRKARPRRIPVQQRVRTIGG